MPAGVELMIDYVLRPHAAHPYNRAKSPEIEVYIVERETSAYALKSYGGMK